MIAEHLLATDDYEIEGNLASLLFRYGDAAVLPDVLGKLESGGGNLAREPLNQMLAYVLKVDPRPLGHSLSALPQCVVRQAAAAST